MNKFHNPVLRNEDGKAGFFDVIEKKFYASDIGNDLIYGKKIGHHFDNGEVTREPSHDLYGQEHRSRLCNPDSIKISRQAGVAPKQATYWLFIYIGMIKSSLYVLAIRWPI